MLIGEISTFILVIIFVAFDFWTVQNVTGRLLVNLRWWKNIDEQGIEKTVYECDDGKKEIGNTDATVFWAGLYSFPIFWIVMILVELITLKFFWVYLCIVCFCMSITNAKGYYYC